MAGMDYQKAKDTRAKSFGDLMSDKLVSGQGIGQSLSATISQKTKASMKGLKEKIDPLNIAKFMTGGSSLGPALLGKVLGRSKEDIKFFAGKGKKGTASKLGPLGGGSDDLTGILYDIEKLLQSSLDADKLAQEKENNSAEEKELERLRRHKELIEAITGKKYNGKGSATKMEKDKDGGGSLIDSILEFFGVAGASKDIFKSLGRFLISAPGLGLIGAAAMGYFIGYILPSIREFDKAERPEDYKDVPLDKSKKNNTTMGAEAAENQRKTYKQVRASEIKQALETKPEFTDDELVSMYGKPRAELEQWLNLNPKGVLQVIPEEKQIQPIPISTIPAETPVTSPPPAATPMPAETPKSGQQLNSVQKENLNLNMPVSSLDPSTTVNNNVNSSPSKGQKRTNIPLVRNAEETIQRMIYNNTRVV
jgi:hypothetical protein